MPGYEGGCRVDTVGRSEGRRVACRLCTQIRPCLLGELASGSGSMLQGRGIEAASGIRGGSVPSSSMGENGRGGGRGRGCGQRGRGGAAARRGQGWI